MAAPVTVVSQSHTDPLNSRIPTKENRGINRVKEASKGFRNVLHSVGNQFKRPIFSAVQNANRDPSKAAANAEANRARQSAIGGEHRMLTAKDGATVSTTYISAQAFTEKVNQAGGRQVRFAQGQNAIAGLAFSKKEGHRFLDALKGSTFEKIGWTRIEDGESVYIVSTEDFAALQAEGCVDEKQHWIPNETFDIWVSDQPLSYATNSTVILCHSLNATNVSLSVMNDVAAYLALGLNVMLVDLRGKGLSEGLISEKGFQRDLEAVRSHLHQMGIHDKTMYFVGNCFGAGPAARFARDKEVNLILNQTPADSESFAAELISCKEFDTRCGDGSTAKAKRRWLPSVFEKIYYTIFGFKYDIAGDLKAKDKGHIGVIFNESDLKVSFKHDQAISEAMFSGKRKGQVIKPIHVGGIEHGKGWYTRPDKEHNCRKVGDFNTAIEVDEDTSPEMQDWVHLNEQEKPAFSFLGKEQILSFLRQTGAIRNELLYSF